MAEDIKITVDTSDLKLLNEWLNKTGQTAKISLKTAENSFEQYKKEVQAAERETRRVKDAYESVKSSIDPLYASTKRYNRELRDIKAFHAQAGSSAEELQKDIEQLNQSYKRAGMQFNQYGQLANVNTRRFKRFGAVGLQQVGYQVGDFAVQLQGGTNAAVALGQQGSQLLGIFGPVGAILGAVLAVTTAFAAPMLDSADATSKFSEEIEQLKNILSPLEPVFNAITAGVRAMGNALIDGINFLINNLDRVLSYALALSGLMAGKFVASMVVAAAGVIKLGSAFTLLKGAIVRTGIGVLIVGLGEAIYWTTQLVSKTGSFGNALEALGGVAKEVWTGIRESAKAIGPGLESVWATVKASFFNFLSDMTEAWSRFIGGLGADLAGVSVMGKNPFKGVSDDLLRISGEAATTMSEYDAKAQSAAASSARLATEAANLANKGFDRVSEAVSKLKGLVFDTEGGDQFDLRSVIDKIMGGMGADADDASGGGAGAESNLEKLLKEIQNRRELLDLYGQELELKRTIQEVTSQLGDEAQNMSQKEIEGLAKILMELDKLEQEKSRYLENVQSVADTMESSMSNAFMSMVEGTKSFGDAMKEMARVVIKELFDILVVQQLVGSFNAKTGEASGIVGFLGKLLPNANGNAFSNGKVTAFANGGVVNGPTIFPMANGAGLMGEAGPEAIMPLKRGKNGKLGVQVEGSQGNVTVQNHFHIAANGDESVKRIIAQEAPRIANLTQKQILDQRRRGGTFKSTFG